MIHPFRHLLATDDFRQFLPNLRNGTPVFFLPRRAGEKGFEGRSRLVEVAGLPMSADMQGRSLLSVLRGRTPSDWRTSMYYRYYHDPGDHNTRAHC